MAEVNGCPHDSGHEGITLGCPLSCLGLRSVGDLLRLLVTSGRELVAVDPSPLARPEDGTHEHERVTLACPVTCLELSPRVFNILRGTGSMRTVGDVLRLLESGWLEHVRGIGRRRAGEIRTALILAGFSASRYPSLRV